jgi:hypothetical protein
VRTCRADRCFPVRSWVGLPAALLPCLLAACSSGPAPGADADADGGDAPADDAGVADFAVAVEPPVPPEPAALPVLTPCPSGWRELGTGTDEVTCDPWPEGGPQDCAVDEAHFPGAPGCVRVGTPCPAGDWADDLPTDVPVLFVRAGAPAGGSGTRDAPFATLAEATEAAVPGTVVALSKGTFDEAVELHRLTTLWGACVAETLVTCSDSSTVAVTVYARGRETGVRNLRIEGNRPGVMAAGEASSMHLQDVVIANVRPLGAVAGLGGTLTASGLVIRDTRNDPSGVAGIGLQIGSGAHVELSRAVFLRNRVAGIASADVNTTVALADVAVLDTASASDGSLGHGLDVVLGAQATVERSVVQGSRHAGIAVGGAGSQATLSQVVVRDTHSQERPLELGFGLRVIEGAQASASRSLFERSAGVNVLVEQVDSVLTLADVVSRDGLAREPDGLAGVGLSVETGARLDARRLLVARSRLFGVQVATAIAGPVAGTAARVEDLVVRDTESQAADGVGGRGINIEGPIAFDATRVRLERNRDVGLFAAGDGATLTLADLVVADTRCREVDGVFGRGVELQQGARAELHRAVVERNGSSGVFVAEAGTGLVATDLAIRETRGHDSDGRFGRGLEVALGAQATVERLSVERTRELGIGAFAEGTTLRATQVLVEDTAVMDCAAGACAENPGGMGVGSYGGASLVLERFVLVRNVLCGLQLATGRASSGVPWPVGGTADFSEGQVSGSPIGVNVQTEGFEVSRLMDRVVYVGNERNLDTANLPVPSGSATVPVE